MTLSDRLKHFFHVVSNIRPIVWIGLYVAITPIFALIYWALPDAQFRIPDGATTDFGSWLYYSIVTITTLGFGDYTPAHGWAQGVTAIEVMCGLIFLGFFLNAVGSMKSEIDITSEQEKQKRIHEEAEKRKLVKSAPILMHNLNTFLAYCYALTTPKDKRKEDSAKYNPDFSISDMCDMYAPSGLPIDNTTLPAVTRLVKSLRQTSLALDKLQSNIDMTIWPEILEESFKFVANYQMFDSEDVLLESPVHMLSAPASVTRSEAEQTISAKIRNCKDVSELKNDKDMSPILELYYLIKQNAVLAQELESSITKAVEE